MSKIPLGPWHLQPELWDTLKIGEHEVPGIATCEITRANKWDSKKAKGEHGQEREFSGAEAAKVRITAKFWTEEQWAGVVDVILPIIEPNPEKKKIDSISISHAVAAARKVSTITIDSVDGPRVDGGIGTLTIEATEYRAPSPKNATGTATGKGGYTSTKSGSCQDLANQITICQSEISQNQFEINNLTAQMAAFEGSLAYVFTAFMGETTAKIEQLQARNVELNQQIQALQQQQILIGCSGESGTGASTSPETQGPEEFYGLTPLES